MFQGDEVFRIERQRLLENRARFIETVGFEQGLTKDNVPAHVAGLLWQVFATNRDGLCQVTRLSIFVGEGREIPSRILLVLIAEFLNAVGVAHPSVPQVKIPWGRRTGMACRSAPS